jgi:hypothetical protein
MGNPILEMLDSLNSQRPAINPQQLLNNNPYYQEAVNYINQHGGDPKTAYYNACAERGRNPNDILSILRGGIQQWAKMDFPHQM